MLEMLKGAVFLLSGALGKTVYDGYVDLAQDIKKVKTDAAVHENVALELQGIRSDMNKGFAELNHRLDKR